VSDTFEVRLDRVDGYRFRADFGLEGVEPLTVDEPPPLGEGRGPNPARLLALAVGNCLSASLVFCLSKSRIEIGSVETTVVGSYRRNERGRLRIDGLDVSIRIDLAGTDRARVEKCLGAFEDFCVVTASVRRGIDVGVIVQDTNGETLLSSPAAGSG
jgi:organic hydroperoxide reductase OsmC/OhrA